MTANKFSFLFILIFLTSLILKQNFVSILDANEALSKINVKRKENLLAAIYEFGLWST